MPPLPTTPHATPLLFDRLSFFWTLGGNQESVRESATSQNRNVKSNKLVRFVNKLGEQLRNFKIKNKTLIKQLQVLEIKVSKFKE